MIWQWYVYILENSQGLLYTGSCLEPDARVRVHNEGRGARYTRGKGPWSLILKIPAESRSAAQKLEAAIKKMSKRKKLLFIKDHHRRREDKMTKEEAVEKAKELTQFKKRKYRLLG